MFGSKVSNSCTYIAIFSEPYKGMIRCDILPKDRKIGVYGSPTIDAFLFKFTNKGEIYQLYKAKSTSTNIWLLMLPTYHNGTLR